MLFHIIRYTLILWSSYEQSEYRDRILQFELWNSLRIKRARPENSLILLGLDWEEACLSPHKNQRSVTNRLKSTGKTKVYKGSSEAWRKYEPYLGGVHLICPLHKPMTKYFKCFGFGDT